MQSPVYILFLMALLHGWNDASSTSTSTSATAATTTTSTSATASGTTAAAPTTASSTTAAPTTASSETATPTTASSDTTAPTTAPSTTPPATSTAGAAPATTPAATTSSGSGSTSTSSGSGSGSTPATEINSTMPSLVQCYDHTCTGKALDDNCLSSYIDVYSHLSNFSTCFDSYCKISLKKRHFVTTIQTECVNVTCESQNTAETMVRAQEQVKCCSSDLCNVKALLDGAPSLSLPFLLVLLMAIVAVVVVRI